MHQAQQQTTQGRCGGFVAGEKQQEQLLGYVVVTQGQTGFIQATSQQIEPASCQGCSGCRGALGLLEHGTQTAQQALAGLKSSRVGAARQGKGQGEETPAPGFEILK